MAIGVKLYDASGNEIISSGGTGKKIVGYIYIPAVWFTGNYNSDASSFTITGQSPQSGVVESDIVTTDCQFIPLWDEGLLSAPATGLGRHYEVGGASVVLSAPIIEELYQYLEKFIPCIRSYDPLSNVKIDNSTFMATTTYRYDAWDKSTLVMSCTTNGVLNYRVPDTVLSKVTGTVSGMFICWVNLKVMVLK